MSTGNAEDLGEEGTQFVDAEKTLTGSTAFPYPILFVNPDKYQETLDFLAGDFWRVMEVQGTPVSEVRTHNQTSDEIKAWQPPTRATGYRRSAT
jgi:hypothetical protein